jgi:hypothetical protein
MQPYQAKDYRIIVNPRVAALMEKYGYVRDRDFLVSEPLPAVPAQDDWPVE